MQRIGRYEIERELGRGAMGAVYLALDPRLGRQVAVKVIHLPEGLSDEERLEFRERFLREARAAASLSHPGIVTVHDAGQDPDSGTPFLAMEYVAGRTLREILDGGGPLDAALAREWIVAVAGALGAAHEAGIVHRDVKPANLLVRERDRQIKIVDFGVARLADSKLTHPDTALGSPAYMSPEQARGAAVDARSDLFSLAAILYEALCGERPFSGTDVPALLYAVVHEDPVPATRRAPGLPAALDTFFERALAKDPEARFATAAEFRDALDGAFAGRGQQGLPTVRRRPPVRRSARRQQLALAATAVLLLVGALVAFGARQRRAWFHLEAKNALREATLSVLVDGKEVFHRELDAPARRAGALHRLLDPASESFESWIDVSPGKHELAALVVPDDGTTPRRDTIAVELEPGEQRRLRLVAGRSQLTLEVD